MRSVECKVQGEGIKREGGKGTFNWTNCALLMEYQLSACSGSKLRFFANRINISLDKYCLPNINKQQAHGLKITIDT